MNIRFAAPEDIDKYVRVRFDYFAAEGWIVPDELKEKMNVQLRAYFISHLNSDFFVSFAEINETIASVAFLTVNEMPANLFAPTGKFGTILNVLTYPQYRRNGYAAKALELLIKKGKEENLSYIQLSASHMGKYLYEKLGFKVSDKAEHTDMRLPLM